MQGMGRDVERERERERERKMRSLFGERDGMRYGKRER